MKTIVLLLVVFLVPSLAVADTTFDLTVTAGEPYLWHGWDFTFTGNGMVNAVNNLYGGWAVDLPVNGSTPITLGSYADGSGNISIAVTIPDTIAITAQSDDPLVVLYLDAATLRQGDFDAAFYQIQPPLFNSNGSYAGLTPGSGLYYIWSFDLEGVLISGAPDSVSCVGSSSQTRKGAGVAPFDSLRSKPKRPMVGNNDLPDHGKHP